MGPIAPTVPVEYILGWGERRVFRANTSIS